MTFWEVDILGVDILRVDILGVDILGVDILGVTFWGRTHAVDPLKEMPLNSWGKNIETWE